MLNCFRRGSFGISALNVLVSSKDSGRIMGDYILYRISIHAFVVAVIYSSKFQAGGELDDRDVRGTDVDLRLKSYAVVLGC